MKKLLLILLTLTVCIGLFAKEMNTDRRVDSKITDVHQLGRAPQSISNAKIVKEFTLNSNQGTSRYNYDVYTGNTTGLTYNAVDLATGALTPTGAIGSAPFPMAEEYDGNAIYRVYNDLSIVEVNPDDGTTTTLGSVSGVAGTPTGLPYKWDTSTMYIVILDGGNAPHFCTLDLTTFIATDIGVGTGMVIAMDFADDGYLYTPSIDDDNFYQVDPATGISTLIGPIGYDLNYGQDVTYDYLTNQLFTISCGGAYILGTYDLSTGALTQIADMGGNQHAVLVSTVASTDPDAPAAPSDVVVTPDASGALSCDISWTCPDLTFGGAPLTELLEMCVYRDDELIYTDSSPVIGGPGNYTDYPTVAGLYIYSVVGFNTVGEGGSVSVSVWVGEDVPNFVEDLLLVGEYGYGHLTWTNPIDGLNGGAFNNAILGYHIERSDGVLYEVTGLLTEYWDIDIPGAGSYYYDVTPYNAIGDGGIASSNTALLNAGGTLIMEDFSTWLPAGWTTTSTSGQINWAQGTGNYAGGAAPEAQFSWSPSTTATQRLISPVLDTSGATDLALEFKHSVNDYNGAYALYVQTTSDGTTWNEVISIPPATTPATTVVETVSTPDVGSATFQIAWVFDGNSFNINYWYVDDVMLIGPYTPPAPGYITGLVTLEGGTGDVEDVQVTAAYVTVNPDADGIYEIEVLPGTFDVTATLYGYDPDVVSGVVVEEGATTSDVDLTLEAIVGVDDEVVTTTKLLNNYPNPFNPVTNIAYSINETGNVTIDVYNLKGQLVKSLVNEVIETGDHIVTWNGRDNSNKSVASGVYFYKMKSSNYTATKKMILMK